MTLASGQEVRDMLTLKAALIADRELIIKGIIEKLISYAHGRELTRADRSHVDEIYAAIEPREFSFTRAVHAIVRTCRVRPEINSYLGCDLFSSVS